MQTSQVIYELKQSSHIWYAKLSSILEVVRFKRSNVDSSLFVRIESTERLIILIDVDHIIITCDSIDEINTLKHSFHQKFTTKDLGVLKYFIGIEMTTFHNGLFLNQSMFFY